MLVVAEGWVYFVAHFRPNQSQGFAVGATLCADPKCSYFTF